MDIEIYTDGACSGNPGKGGWGALLIWGEHQKKLSGYEAHTTNNRMELMAAIKALEEIKQPLKPNMRIKLYTDSTYVKNGIESWLANWKRNQWRTSNKKPVKNIDLWQALDHVANSLPVEWCWVKGHAGNEGNEIADALARNAIMAQNI